MNKLAIAKLGESWANVIGEEFEKPYMHKLAHDISKERKKFRIYPSQTDVFRAFKETPYDKVKVCMMLQDPYNRGEATGLGLDCSRTKGLTASMKKVLEVYQLQYPNHFNTDLMDGNMTPWAAQGTLLINAALTVRAHKPEWHITQWSPFMRAVMTALNKKEHVVFVFIGSYARTFASLIDRKQHAIIQVEHPAAASYGNRLWAATTLFLDVNNILYKFGEDIINW